VLREVRGDEHVMLSYGFPTDRGAFALDARGGVAVGDVVALVEARERVPVADAVLVEGFEVSGWLFGLAAFTMAANASGSIPDSQTGSAMAIAVSVSRPFSSAPWYWIAARPARTITG
jgi:hypothetical protein